jgi:hypothetical protein
LSLLRVLLWLSLGLLRVLLWLSLLRVLLWLGRLLRVLLWLSLGLLRVLLWLLLGMLLCWLLLGFCLFLLRESGNNGSEGQEQDCCSEMCKYFHLYCLNYRLGAGAEIRCILLTTREAAPLRTV